MDIVLESDYTDTQVERINGVRERLGVQYLSKIATIDRRFIDEQILIQQKPVSYQTTRKCVKEELPNKQSWNLFKKVTDSICV